MLNQSYRYVNEKRIRLVANDLDYDANDLDLVAMGYLGPKFFHLTAIIMGIFSMIYNEVLDCFILPISLFLISHLYLGMERIWSDQINNCAGVRRLSKQMILTLRDKTKSILKKDIETLFKLIQKPA